MDMVDMERRLRLLGANLLPTTHRILQRLFPHALWMGDPEKPHIALTFDDGPHLQDTPQLLHALEKHQIAATFFLIGERVEKNPHLAREIASAGHQVGIHGYYHRPFPLENPTLLRQHLDATRALIADACGYAPEDIQDVRPPFGVFTPETLQLLQRWHYRPVMWRLVPLHWLQPAQETVSQVTKQVRNGDIIVLHEGHGTPPIVHLVDEIVPRLVAAGFHYITIDQMWHSVTRH